MLGIEATDLNTLPQLRSECINQVVELVERLSRISQLSQRQLGATKQGAVATLVTRNRVNQRGHRVGRHLITTCLIQTILGEGIAVPPAVLMGRGCRKVSAITRARTRGDGALRGRRRVRTGGRLGWGRFDVRRW